MTLLEHYLKAVRLYLPRGAGQDDIINELSELLQSTMDEKEESLGRPLTEDEQLAILSKHGNPVAVAGRYGAKNRSVAFGWQLIGPELFPLYSRILALNWTLTLCVPFVISAFAPNRPLSWRGVITPMIVQFTIVTVIFTGIDYLRSKSAGWWLQEERHWQFPPLYFQHIPRWQSLSGGLVLLVTLVWWILLPFVPQLLLGPAATTVEVVSSVRWIYVPALLALAAGVAQRAVTLQHPEKNVLQAVTRLCTNLAGVLLAYPFATNYPAIVAKDPSNVEAAAGALRLSNVLWWLVVPSFGLYWLITAGFHLWMCIQHLRHARRRRLEQTAI